MKTRHYSLLIVCLAWLFTSTTVKAQSVTSTKPEMWMNKYNSGFLPVIDGDTIGTIRFRGLMSDNEFRTGASIVSYISQPVADNYLAAHMKFRTGAPFLEDRMIILDNGNIGIGTNSPDELFHVNGKSKTINFQMTDSPTLDYVLASDAQGNGTWRDPNDLIDKDADWYVAGTTVEPYDINDDIYTNGRIGIGVDVPTVALDVVGSSNLTGDLSTGGDISTEDNLFVEDKVGIGLTSLVDMPGTHKLYVGGSVVCEEVKVAFQADWPDYVFEDNYDLPKTSELEKFIKANKHLPGIPSAKDVKEEGIELGQMQGKLLEKIEELTLIIIEQQKQIDDLKETVKQK